MEKGKEGGLENPDKFGHRGGEEGEGLIVIWMFEFKKNSITNIYLLPHMARNHGHDLFYFLRNLHTTLKYGFCIVNSKLYYAML